LPYVGSNPTPSAWKFRSGIIILVMIKQVQAAPVDLRAAYNVPFSNLGELVSSLLSNVYAIMAVIFLILIIIGGWGMIVGAGKGEGGKVEQGGKAISLG